MTSNDLAAAERRAFRSVVDTGLWDVMLASVVSMFALAPLLSTRLGDFWSSAVFLPVWLATYLILRIVRARFVEPRVGVVRFGPQRVERLRKFGVILVAVNVVSLIAAAVFAARSETASMAVYPFVFALIVLAVSSIAAYAYNIPRVLFYGVLIALAPAIGEWLWRSGYASHHGYPVVYGITTLVIAGTGLGKLARLLQHHPPASSTAG